MAQKLLNDLEDKQNHAQQRGAKFQEHGDAEEQIEMMQLLENVLDDTESLMSEISFNEAFY